MHSQNPDVTGMRDLPPLREPALPSGPHWRHDQSKAEHLAEVEAHAVLRGSYETNKAAYAAERAKRRDQGESTLSARGAGVAVARWAFDGAHSGPTEWPDDLNQPEIVAAAEMSTDQPTDTLVAPDTSALITKWRMTLTPVCTSVYWEKLPDGGWKSLRPPIEKLSCWRAVATQDFVFTAATLSAAVSGLAEELENSSVNPAL